MHYEQVTATEPAPGLRALVVDDEAALADVRFGAGPSQISRQDRSRVATITAELDGIVVGEASKRVHALPSVKNLPNGVKEVAAGDVEFIQEMVTGFAAALITSMCNALPMLFNRAPIAAEGAPSAAE